MSSQFASVLRTVRTIAKELELPLADGKPRLSVSLPADGTGSKVSFSVAAVATEDGPAGVLAAFLSREAKLTGRMLVHGHPVSQSEVIPGSAASEYLARQWEKADTTAPAVPPAVPAAIQERGTSLPAPSGNGKH